MASILALSMSVAPTGQIQLGVSLATAFLAAQVLEATTATAVPRLTALSVPEGVAGL